MIEQHKKEILYNKPIYVGTSILDISKLTMMKFHYNIIHKNFENNYNLLYSDTDSLIYSIKHEDIYEWIKQNKEHFDLSDCQRLDLYDNTNKKVLEKMKEENNCLPISEFVGLNPKVYSLMYEMINNDNEFVLTNKKAMKGVSKTVVKKDIKHQDLIDTFNRDKPFTKEVMSIRSFKHELFLYSQTKVALTAYYDKMKMLDEINCVPFGYKE